MSRTYTLSIEITAANKTRGVFSGLTRSMDSLGGAADRASPRLGRLGTAIAAGLGAAAGVAIVAGIGAITRGIMGLGKSAIESVSNVQALEMSLMALFAERNMYQEVNKVREVAIKLTGQERQKLQDLGLAYDTQAAKIQEQKQRIWEYTNKWTDAGLVTKKAKAQLAEMESQLTKTGAAISALQGKEGQLVTVTSTRIQQVMEYEEAQRIAEGQTRKLLDSLTELAIVSPFETSQVEQIGRMAVMAGMAEGEIRGFTSAFLDFAAARGFGNELGFVADQFLQIQQTGKILEIDIRQLRRRGFDLSKVMAVDMGMSAEELTARFGELTEAEKKLFSGMSVEEFNKLVGKSPELMEAMFQKFTVYSEATTAGAAQKLTQTISGMMSTAADIVEVGSRKLFRPIIEAVSPSMSGVLENIAALVTGGKMEEIGKNLADKLMGKLAEFRDSPLFAFFKNLFTYLKLGLRPMLAFRTALRRFGDSKTVNNVKKLAGAFGGVLDSLKKVAGLVKTSLGKVFGALSGGEDAGGGIRSLVDFLLTIGIAAMEAFAKVLEVLANNWAIVEAAAIAFGVILAGREIIGGLLKVTRLMSPINLAIGLIAGAVVLLQKAWENNWGDIQGKTEAVWEKIEPIFSAIGGFVSGLVGALAGGEDVKGLGELFAGFGEALVNLGVKQEIVDRILALGDAIGPLVEGVKSLVEGDVPGAISNFAEAMGEVAEAVLGLDESQTASVAASLEKIGLGMVGIADSIATMLATDGVAAWENTLGWAKDYGEITAANMTAMAEASGNLAGSLDLFFKAFDIDDEAKQKALGGLLEHMRGLFLFKPNEDLARDLNNIATAIKNVTIWLGKLDEKTGILTKLGFVVDTSAVENLEGFAEEFEEMIPTEMPQPKMGVIDWLSKWVQPAGDQAVQEQFLEMFNPVEEIQVPVPGESVFEMFSRWAPEGEAEDALTRLVTDPLIATYAALASRMALISPPLTDALVQPIEDASDQLVGHSIVPDMVDNIVAEIGRLAKEAPKEASRAVPALVKVGRAMVDGLKKGVQNNWQTFVDYWKSIIYALIKDIKAKLGMKSPSKQFAQIGQSMAQGMLLGWDKTLAGASLTVPGVGAMSGGSMAIGASAAFGGGGGNVYNDYHINDRGTAALLLAQAGDVQRQRLNNFMGA